MEHGLPSGTLGIIIEPVLQDVLHVLWVARDSHEPLLSCQKRDCSDTGLVRAAARAKIVSDPVMHAIGVLDETWQATQ